jgi:hypothetical protein
MSSSDHPEFSELLVAAGIDSISVNPESVPAVRIGSRPQRRGSGDPPLPARRTCWWASPARAARSRIEERPRVVEEGKDVGEVADQAE